MRSRRNARSIAVLIVLAMLMTACGGAGNKSDDKTDANQTAIPSKPDNTLLPAPSTARSADALAKQILAGKDDVLPALITAITRSGFGIGDLDGKIYVPAAEPSMGVGFMAGQVIGLAQLAQRGSLITGEEFAQVLALSLERPDNPEARASILRGIRQDVTRTMKDEEPTVKFWGQFMNALARRGEGAYDMRELAFDPFDKNFDQDTYRMTLRKVWIDPVQALFVLVPLYARLRGLGLTAKSSTNSAMSNLVLVAAQEDPCGKMNEKEEFEEFTVKPEVAKRITDKVAEELGEAFVKAVKALERMNMLLTVVRYIIMQLNMETTLEVIGGPPIVRTKSHTSDGTPESGKTRTLKVGVRFDTPSLQYLTCLNKIAAVGKLDLTIPKSGGAPDMEITWHMSLDNPEWFPLQWARGECSKGPRKGACISITDDEGYASIKVEGIHQKVDLSKGRLKAMRRKIGVSVTVAKQTKLFESLVSAVLSYTSPIDILSEVLQRMGTERGWRVLVKDWDVCIPDATPWGGGNGSLRRTILGQRLAAPELALTC